MKPVEMNLTWRDQRRAIRQQYLEFEGHNTYIAGLKTFSLAALARLPPVSQPLRLHPSCLSLRSALKGRAADT